jgi:hypothetical protein
VRDLWLPNCQYTITKLKKGGSTIDTARLSFNAGEHPIRKHLHAGYPQAFTSVVARLREALPYCRGLLIRPVGASPSIKEDGHEEEVEKPASDLKIVR